MGCGGVVSTCRRLLGRVWHSSQFSSHVRHLLHKGCLSMGGRVTWQLSQVPMFTRVKIGRLTSQSIVNMNVITGDTKDYIGEDRKTQNMAVIGNC